MVHVHALRKPAIGPEEVAPGPLPRTKRLFDPRRLNSPRPASGRTWRTTASRQVELNGFPGSSPV